MQNPPPGAPTTGDAGPQGPNPYSPPHPHDEQRPHPGQQPPPIEAIDFIVPVNVKNGLAVASGYLGIFSLFCFGPLLGIPALITGYLALKKPHLGGKGRAWTGIITGGIATVVYPLIWVAANL